MLEGDFQKNLHLVVTEEIAQFIDKAIFAMYREFLQKY